MGKRGVVASNKCSSKRGKVLDTDVAEAIPPDNNAKSDVKSAAKSDLVATMTFAFANASTPREGLVQ